MSFEIKVTKPNKRTKTYRYSYGTKDMWMAIAKRSSIKNKNNLYTVFYQGYRGWEWCEIQGGLKGYCSEEH